MYIKSYSKDGIYTKENKKEKRIRFKNQELMYSSRKVPIKLKGSALVENILLIAISLVLIVVIFYPQIVNMFNKVMDSLSIWFENAISAIGVVK